MATEFYLFYHYLLCTHVQFVAFTYALIERSMNGSIFSREETFCDELCG